MGALSEQTGTRPETVRSWERRYGFPQPARTATNLRMYTERDIEAIRWLLEQTAQGQSISAAIGMLRRRLDAGPEAPSLSAATAAPHAHPTDNLIAALLVGHLANAQAEWDVIAIGTSLDALAIHVLLPASQSLDPSQYRSLAFLLRKATVLLDHAAPDTGTPNVGILAPANTASQVVATVLATCLARAGARVITPFADPGSMDALSQLRAAAPDNVIVLTGGVSSPNPTLATLLGVDTVETCAPSSEGIRDVVARIARS